MPKLAPKWVQLAKTLKKKRMVFRWSKKRKQIGNFIIGNEVVDFNIITIDTITTITISINTTIIMSIVIGTTITPGNTLPYGERGRSIYYTPPPRAEYLQGHPLRDALPWSGRGREHIVLVLALTRTHARRAQRS